ncbi:hypothetical protein GOHSU_30_00620 [Gordonia hirsuta DSM 44140 = NBRC 16056]|uniref:Uncharacterized protein n=1 Tax=Gordonia hirsuta DSM 44140 = NBRC 16056 TaxID=1121927 RepID=L7LDL7_9ACTN|nr:hypothetical protein [Gordonia hirsuta]GAC58138.1 hypothetical protein GOHSU_30_00620 [Gordonia hirsuta DSM 44140 = NBRC 16056]
MAAKTGSTASVAPRIAEGDEALYRVDIGSRKGAVVVAHRVDEPVGVELTTRTVATVNGEDITIVVDQRFVRAGDALRAVDCVAVTYDGDRMIAREEVPHGGRVTSVPQGLWPIVVLLTMVRGMDLTPGRRRVRFWPGDRRHRSVGVRVGRRTVRKVGERRVGVIPLKVRPGAAGVDALVGVLVSGRLQKVEILLEATPARRTVAMKFPTGPFPWHARGYLELETE